MHYNKDKSIFLKNFYKKFFYIIYSIKKQNVLILNSVEFSCFLNKETIALPACINFFNNNRSNYYLYLYKILFFSYLNDYHFNKLRFFYSNFYFVFLYKIVKKSFFEDSVNIKKIEFVLYPLIPYFNITFNSKCSFLLKKLWEKFNYNIIFEKFFFNHYEKRFFYLLENFNLISDNLLKNIFNNLFFYLKKINNNDFYVNINIFFFNIKLFNDFSENFSTNQKKNVLDIFFKKKYDKIIFDKNEKLINLIKVNKKKSNVFFDYNSQHNTYDLKNISNIINDYSNHNSYENTDFLFKTNNDLEYFSGNNTFFSNLNLLNSSINLFYDYDEWDFKINDYKKKWCRVFESNFSFFERDLIQEKNLFLLFKKYKNIIEKIKKKIILLNNKFIFEKNYLKGKVINIDLYIDNFLLIKNFNFEKIYENKIKNKKDFFIIILLDASSSTERGLYNEKNIDFIKILSLIIASFLEKNIKYEISFFNSNTRHDCKYIKIKNSFDKLNQCIYKIFNFNTSGYTRIGAAIRHSLKLINKKKEKEKIVIIISDGCPTDYDEYEGEYGLKDIKATFNEAKRKNIKIKMLLFNNNISRKQGLLSDNNNVLSIDEINYKNLNNIFNFIFLK